MVSDKVVFYPLLFRFYIKDVVLKLTGIGYGCNIDGIFVNLLCYADDIVMTNHLVLQHRAYLICWRQKLQLIACLVIARKQFVWYLVQ